MPKRNDGGEWFEWHFGKPQGPLHVSKHYAAGESWAKRPAWWFELPVSDLDSGPTVHLLCEQPDEPGEFLALLVPTEFLCRAKDRLHFRNDVKRYSLYLSSERGCFLTELRGHGRVEFLPFAMFPPRRELGRTGFVASRIGIGDLADRNVPLDECVATVRRAIDRRCNVIDTAPAYENGYSEEIVGRAVKSCRDRMFVIDKIDHLDRSVREQVEESLGRLALDHVDLFAFHGVSKPADWTALAAPGGGMEQLGALVKEGKCRFRGISSHHPDVLREAIESGPCDVVLFAVGPFCDERYVSQILPLARQWAVGTVCFKTFGAGKLLGDTAGYGRPLEARPRGKLSSGGKAPGEPALTHLSVDECVRYTLTCDPDVALLGLSFPNEQDAAWKAAATFKPMTPAEIADIRARAVEAMRDKGEAWWNPAL